MNSGQHLSQEAKVSLAQVYFRAFTEGAKSTLVRAVEEYTDSLREEAARLEARQHSGEAPREITVAHVIAAKQVLQYRLPRQSKWIWLLRPAQAVSLAGTGIGGSNLTQGWGVPVLIIALILALLFFVVEREITREK